MTAIRIKTFDDAAKEAIKQYDVVILDRPSLHDLALVISHSSHIKQLTIYNYAGRILPSFAPLVQVEKLELIRMNEIRTLPNDIGSLHQLRVLNMSATDCALPASFGDLKRLEELSITGCHLGEEFSAVLSELTRLKYLRIQECIGEHLPALHRMLNSLEELCIYNCKELIYVNLIGCCPKLTKFIVSGTPSVTTFPEEIRHLPKLLY